MLVSIERNDFRLALQCNGTTDFWIITQAFEKALIEQALYVMRNNKKQAAKLLGLQRTTLIDKCNKLGIEEQTDLGRMLDAISRAA